MRIQVLFHNDNTWVVVPCGDGKITISQLINRATARFKKITNTHLDGDLKLGSICLHHKGTYVDQEDAVADVLKNNEAVVLQQTSWVGSIGSNPSNTKLTIPEASQDTKAQLSGRRTTSMRSIDSGCVTSQGTSNSQESYGLSSQNVTPRPPYSPYHNTNLSVGSQSPLLGIASRSTQSFLRGKRDDKDKGTSLWGERRPRPESDVSIDDDTDREDEDTVEKVELDSNENLLSVESDKNNIQELNVTPITSQSECSHTPSPSSPEDKSCEHSADEDEREYGKIHIIELHKGNEPLGIHLDDTSPGLIPGLFIGAMDENGFAFKSGKFQHNDRILACNGIDFTKPKDHTEPVKVIFNRMAQGHLLRIAVGRTVSSPEATDNGGAEVEADDNVPSSTPSTPNTPMNTGVEQTVEGAKGFSSLGAGLTHCDVVTKSKGHTILQDDVVTEVGADVPSEVFHLDSEDATPTLSSPMSHEIIVSGEMPPSQPTSLMSTSEQEQLSLENTSEKLSTMDSNSHPTLSSGEVVVPPLRPINGEGVWNLRCVEVCRETSVVVHHCAQQFIWEGFGLKLHIYEGCLPADMEQCIINIKASLAGLYEFPENMHLVSAVFWLRCIPECKFDKSVGLEIQHCGNQKGDSRLSFVRAICCQKELPYTFKDIGGDFTNHSFYGFIELKGFSGLAVVQEGSEERQYLASLLYKEINVHRSRCIVEIYFAITWNVDAHHNVVITTFKDALIEAQQLIEFELDHVEFRISNISHEKWDIKCINSAVVKKADVDHFAPGKTPWVPSSKFKAKFSEDLNLVCDLECDVDVIGAMQPHNKFVIDISPQAGSPQQLNYSPLIPSANKSTRLTDFNYRTLLQQLSNHAAKWREIGIHLGFRQGELDNIQSNVLHSTNLPISCLTEVLTRWLQWAPGDSRGSTSFATLEALKEALNQAGLAATAYDLHL